VCVCVVMVIVGVGVCVSFNGWLSFVVVEKSDLAAGMHDL